MVRQQRIQYPGAWYHVTQRGAAKQDIFGDDLDRGAFLDRLGDTHSKYNLEIHCYCLMTNHYHLLVRTPDGNLATAMRHLNSTYTQGFNRSHRSDGPLFRGRYGASLIDQDSYLLAATNYIHRNPLKAGIEHSLGSYAWSSLPAFLGRVKQPPWLHTSVVLALHDDSAEQIALRTAQAYGGDIRPGKLILGADAFEDAVIARVRPTYETAYSVESARRRPSLDQIDAAVAETYDVSLEELHRARRCGANRPRMMAVHIASIETLATQAELAERYGYKSYKSVSSALARTVNLCRTDEVFSRRAAEISRCMRAAYPRQHAAKGKGRLDPTES